MIFFSIFYREMVEYENTNAYILQQYRDNSNYFGLPALIFLYTGSVIFSFPSSPEALCFSI